jgi:hypothetical protein
MPATARPNTGFFSGWSDGEVYGAQANASFALIDSLLYARRTHVRAYGAKGDGVTDDTAAVLAAIAAAPDFSQVHFAAGTYILSTWAVQTISKTLWFTGDGIGKTVIKGSAGVGFVSIIKNFHSSDITWDTWQDVLDFSNVVSILDQIIVDRCEFKNYRRGVYANSAVGGIGMSNVLVRKCRFITATSHAVFFNMANLDEIRVQDCYIKDCVERGITMGNNTLVFADLRGNYIVTGNIIDGVTRAGAFAADAILCIGWRALITNNIVRNVHHVSLPEASDCEGIYTKCRYSVISHNILIDAGQEEAFINIKGGARNEGITQPWGFSVICANNIIIDTQVNPTKIGGDRKTAGIKIATSDVLCVNNRLEGLTDAAIYMDSDGGSDTPNHNIVIQGNMVKDHRGNVGINAIGRGNNVRILDNHIENILGTWDPNQVFGIHVTKKGGHGLHVERNLIANLGTPATAVGVSMNPSIYSQIYTVDAASDVFTLDVAHGLSVNDPVKFTTTGVLPVPLVAGTIYFIKTVPTSKTFTISATLGGATLDITTAGTPDNSVVQQTTFTGWRVCDNDIDTAHFGVQFTWDDTNITVSDIFTRHNTGRNINGNVVPAADDLVHYSDLPTTLIDLPAANPAVFIEAANAAAIRELTAGGSPKEFRIYGTWTDSGNFERLLLKSTASAVQALSDFNGTGVARPFEFGNKTNKWRVTAGGTLEAMTNDTFDIGGAATGRPRDIWAGRHLESAGSGAYNTGHIILGTYHIWITQATGVLRIKNGAPANDTDGTVVGTQT